jgi:hypothetical protein
MPEGRSVDIILAPDVYVNASVAPGTSPDRVVQRVLGQHRGESKATEWILSRIAAMLQALPTFKAEAVRSQVDLIRSFVQVVPGAESAAEEDWHAGLVASAKAAKVERVVTDHPDLLKADRVDGVEFVSTESWLLEVTTPPPVPGT